MTYTTAEVLDRATLKSGNKLLLERRARREYRVIVQGHDGLCYTEHSSFAKAATEFDSIIDASFAEPHLDER